MDKYRQEIQAAAKRRYSKTTSIWSHNDPWHYLTHLRIHRFISRIAKEIDAPQSHSVLNVGSAGEHYDFYPSCQVHVDVVETLLQGVPHGVVADIEDLPFPDSSFLWCLCVGSVINYCSALEAISEMSRVIKPGGHLILEYETTTSFEFLGTSKYRKAVDVIDTFYQGETERIWGYAIPYIAEVLSKAGFIILRQEPIHVLSPLIYRISRRENISYVLAHLDSFFSRIPWIGSHSSNIILYCQKTSLALPTLSRTDEAPAMRTAQESPIQ